MNEIAPVFREALACFEVWRRMGYPADAIYFGFEKTGRVAMLLRSGDKTFTYVCGTLVSDLDSKQATARWTEATEIWNSKLGDSERKQIYETSYIRRNAVQLIVAMQAKGFRVRKLN